MNVTVTDVSDLRKELVVALTADEVAHEETLILQELRKQAKVPGFRPGKAPDTILRQRFKQALLSELSNKIVGKAFESAIKEKDLRVFQVVEVKGVEDIKTGEAATVDLTVDLAPQFELPSYEDLQTVVPGTEVTDGEIDEAIERIRRERAQFEVVERPAEKGDYVKLSYTGTIEGAPVKELLPDEGALKVWAGVENGWEEAGTDEAKQFGVPEIIDGLVGMGVDGTKTVTVDFAEDFKVEALRGKQAIYELKTHEVRSRTLPELNEAFFKTLQVESEADLKARLLDSLEGQKKQRQRELQRQQVIDQLLAAVDFPLPESGIEAETQRVMSRIMAENLQRGVPHEEFEKNKERFHAESSQVAVRDLKAQFILSKLAEKEGLEATQEDLQRAVVMTAQQRRQPVEEFVKELRKDREQIQSMQRQILLGKALDFVVGKSKLTVSEDGEKSA